MTYYLTAEEEIADVEFINLLYLSDSHSDFKKWNIILWCQNERK